jgi:NTP pyrophosphatase (non-canonical NTP hydrolase)
MRQKQTQLRALLRAFSAELHQTSKSKGWWQDREKLDLTSAGRVHVDIGCIALAMTELAEAIENVREGYGPDDKIAGFSGLEAELADCIIRILDFAEARNLRLIDAMFAKAEMNKGRAMRHGGKLA